MGTNTLSTKNEGDVIVSPDPNQFEEALQEDFVPRNSSGVPTDQAGGLGQALLRWARSYIKEIILGDPDDDVMIGQSGGTFFISVNGTNVFEADETGLSQARVTQQEITTAQTVTMPQGIEEIEIDLLGGGGGGAGGLNGGGGNVNAGGGGGRGAVVRLKITDMHPTLRDIVINTIGAAGTAGTGGGAGGNGGDTKITYTDKDGVSRWVQAGGGQGGQPGASDVGGNGGSSGSVTSNIPTERLSGGYQYDFSAVAGGSGGGPGSNGAPALLDGTYVGGVGPGAGAQKGGTGGSASGAGGGTSGGGQAGKGGGGAGYGGGNGGNNAVGGDATEYGAGGGGGGSSSTFSGGVGFQGVVYIRYITG